MDVETPHHHSVCCSDRAAVGFGRVAGADHACPYVQTTLDQHASSAMDLETAERGCAAFGARLCTLSEVIGTCVDAEDVWTVDECEERDLGHARVCDAAGCVAVRAPNSGCGVVGPDSGLTKQVVVDETVTGAESGWLQPDVPRPSGWPTDRNCDDDRCSSVGNDCCAPGDEASTCSGGWEAVEFSQDCSGTGTYTCCDPEAVADEGASASAGFLDCGASVHKQSSPLAGCL